MKGVKEAFNQFIVEFSAEEKTQADVSNELVRMLKLRYKNNSPRRPPRIVIVGPPGSGRETQSRLLAKQFGMVHVSVRDILKAEMKNNPEVGKVVA